MAPIGKHRQSLGVPRRRSVCSDTTMPGEKPPTTLKLWIIRFKSGGVVVEGYKAVSENDATTLQNWRSTPIAKRIDAKTLSTHSGSIYKLKGGIDEDEAAEAGISEELIEAFARGFPENWEQLVNEQLRQMELFRRRQSVDTATIINTTMDEEEESRMGRGRNNGALGFDETTEGTTEDEDRLKETQRRRSLQKGRKSMMYRVQPATPIQEEEEEEEEEEKEETPARKKTPARGKTPKEKTPAGRGRRNEEETQEDEEMEDGERMPPPIVTSSLPTRTQKGAPRVEKKKEEEEVFATPHEMGRQSKKRSLSVVAIPNERQENTRRYSLNEIPREIMEKSIPLTRWVIRFLRGGSPDSIFPHFQFKICGFRPEDNENEWTTSVVKKVVPSYIMFTGSSIYRLDGQMDVDLSAEMGFPPSFITDFVFGFPNDWEERLETFYNKTFGGPPQPRIVEVMSDGGTADEEKEKKNEEEKEKEKERPTKKTMEFNTPRAKEGTNRVEGQRLNFHNQTPSDKRKRKEPTPSSSSSSSGDDSESDYEERLRREAEKVEKEMRREEKKAKKEAEVKAKAKEEKKKRFEVQVNTTPNGVRVSRSGRTLRTPMAAWAGERITYDVDGNAVEMTGITTTTKLTLGKMNNDQHERLAAHYGMDSPLNLSTPQQERALAPPRTKTPAPKRSKAENRGYSDDETDKMFYHQYLSMPEATPAFILKKGKRRVNVVESSDSEAEAEKRRKEKKRLRKEERRRLKESEEEESSDDGWRRNKSRGRKKKVVVKKEKVKAAPSKKRQRKRKEESEEEEEGSDLDIEHDEDAITFVPSDDGSNVGNGYSDDDLMVEEEPTSKKKGQKKAPVKRAKAWKQEEVLRLKLAIKAANPMCTVDGWEKVANSVGGERTGEECRKIARERLKMNVDEPREEEEEEEEEEESERGWSGAESGAASEDEEKKKRRNAKMDQNDRPKGITAKKGTIQYAVEMENKKRELIMGGTSSQDDFFKSTKARMSTGEALPSVAVFDPDDSLLDCLDDDDLPAAPKQRTTKTAKQAAVPATPNPSSYGEDHSPFDSEQRSSRRSSSKFIPSPVINQNDLTRYVHQLSRTKNLSMTSKSMAADKSRMLPPALPRGRNVARATNAIEKVENSLRNRRKGKGANNDLEDLDEDEENDNNILPAGF